MIKIGPGAKPNKQYVICTADLDQKKNHKIENTEITLYLETKYNNNYRERNPNYATVVYVPEQDKFDGWDIGREYDQILKPGDRICVQHFQLIDDYLESKQVAEGPNGEPLFFVDLREVYFKIVDDKPILLSNFTLCEYADDLKEKTDSGFIIPDIAKEQIRRDSRRARVIYISDFAKRHGISIGDVVLFIEYADYELEFNGKKYLKIASDEILGKFTDDELISL